MSATNINRYKKTSWLNVVPAAVLALIVSITLSKLADAELFRGDATYYFNLINSGEWLSTYPIEPALYTLLIGFKSDDFSNYILVSSLLPLLIAIVALKKSGGKWIGIATCTLFLSTSFYGLHFLLNFQRQFLAVALFLFYLSSKGATRKISLAASLLSQKYAIILPVFTKLAKRKNIWILFATITIFSIGSKLLAASGIEGASAYADIGQSDPLKYAAKQLLNILFALVAIKYSGNQRSTPRDYARTYIIFSIPALVIPEYAGMFSRIDYFLFPLVVASWASESRNRKTPFIFCTLAYSLSTMYLWLTMNFAWIFLAVE